MNALKLLQDHIIQSRKENQKIEIFIKKYNLILEMIKIANNTNLDNYIENWLKICELKKQYIR